ncbi:MAG: tyrosine-type recombinase/integrase, partial [bacterium]|nr:tyrosine-type recombinase/integrase [bacterium]
MVIRRWFLWLHEKGIIPTDVAKDLELPKPEERLPVDVLTADEVESTMNQTDATRPMGIRDRAILETFYSTGIRASELAHLQLYDLDADRQILIIRQGKGKKDRVVPIGERAIRWLQKYMTDIRPDLVEQTEPHPVLFVTRDGVPIQRSLLALIVKRYMRKAGVKKPGSCHLLRHTAATLMMENGADLRSLQMFLGHVCLKTTQLYTHVSIQRLQDVHRKTHPASISPPKENDTVEENDP